MTFINKLILKLFTLLTITAIVSCDTTRNVYKSTTSKKNYWTINAVTLSHCGCTHLYVDHFQDGKKDFQIFYNDKLARKTIYTYSNNSKTPLTKMLLATSKENFTTSFEPIDLEVFRKIDSIITNKKGIIYPIQRSEYKGYIDDPYYNH